MEKLLNAMPVLTSLILGLLVAIGLAWQGMGLRDEMSVNTHGAQQQTRTQQTDSAPAQAVDLKELTFFGEPGDNAAPQVTDAEDLPETNLQLVLRGVMAGDTEERDSALVEGPDGETEVYRVSESLPGDAVLRKVHRKRIVIERGGALETLSFPENETGDSVTVANANSRSSQSRPEPDASGSSSRNRKFQGREKDVRERLNKLRERLSDN
ncbi:general secretion pathway protein C [Halospina denitrificans]|uniref:General secretion pathway protein C n=1 Tax=Halospina denitrificans TaxID=332522 RepID=A0A4R7JV91_9GAMM|nr:type II secretion system protein N [Halospina denitrificans]TDT41377.1 general secretion pathway protein C [Halospina denitrificans]